MALKPDDTVCFCFKVSLQKIETFCKVQRPKYASEISDCLSAGTGCGWCVPMLKKLHGQFCEPYTPPWRVGHEAASPVRERPAAEVDGESWASGRQQYLTDMKNNQPKKIADGDEKPA
jgi:bacterioferritin-associated ferredoxin